MGSLSAKLEDYRDNPLWPILVETVHALAMYKYHKRYVLNVALRDKPDITPMELSLRLHIPLGEALVLLAEDQADKERK